MKLSPAAKLLILLLLALLAWNYWLSDAWDMLDPAGRSDSGSLHNVDFFAYYTAGARFLDGDNPSFWGRDEQDRPVISDFLYPPGVLPLFGLLARLPYDTARVLWAALYAAAFLTGLAGMTFSFPAPWRFPFLAAALLLTLLSYPLLSHLFHGQVDVFVIVLLLGCYLAHAGGRRPLAAALLAFATLVKVSPGFLLIYFVLFQRDLRFLAWYAGWLAGLAGLSLLTVPAAWYLDYLRFVLPEVASGSSFWLNQSIVKYLADSPLAARAVGLAGLGGLAAVLWLAGRRAGPAARRASLPLAAAGFVAEAAFVLNLAGVLVFLGKAWTATYVWLILPGAWLLVGLAARRASPARLVLAAAGVLLAMGKIYGFPLLDSLNLWGNLILTVSLAAGLLSGRLVPDPPPGPEAA